MFFGPGKSDCFDCTTVNSELLCTMNCGPANESLDPIPPRPQPSTKLLKGLSETRRAAREREQVEADGRDELWTAYGAMEVRNGTDRVATFIVHNGKRDSDEYREAFEANHRDKGILFGPHLMIGDRAAVTAELTRMFKADEMKIRWVIHA